MMTFGDETRLARAAGQTTRAFGAAAHVVVRKVQRGKPVSRWVLITLTVILLLTGLARELTTRIFLDDDYLFLYTGVSVIESPETFRAVKDYVGEGLVRHGATEESLYRFRFRDGSEDNYRLPIYLYWASKQLLWGFLGLDQSAPDETAYESYIMWQTALMFSLAALSAFAVFALLLSAVKSRAWLAGCAVTIAVVTAVNMTDMYTWPATLFDYNRWYSGSAEEIFENLKYLGGMLTKFVLHPGPSYSPSTFVPKNQLQIILVAIFLLRWTGHRGLAYAALFAASFYHHGYGSNLVLFIYLCDATLHPKTARSYPVLGLTAGVLLANLLRGALGTVDWMVPLVAPIPAFLIIVAWAFVNRWDDPDAPVPDHVLVRPLAAVVRSLRQLPAAAGDLIIIWSVWWMSGLVFLAIGSQVSPLQSNYFFGNIHVRLMGLLLLPTQLAVLVGVVAWLRRALRLGQDSLEQIYRAAVAVCIALLVASWVPVAASAWDAGEHARASMEKVHGLEVCDFERLHGTLFETTLYLEMVKSVDFDDMRYVERFFRNGAECDLAAPAGQ